jgi:hypothetical protein
MKLIISKHKTSYSIKTLNSQLVILWQLLAAVMKSTKDKLIMSPIFREKLIKFKLRAIQKIKKFLVLNCKTIFQKLLKSKQFSEE